MPELRRPASAVRAELIYDAPEPTVKGRRPRLDLMPPCFECGLPLIPADTHCPRCKAPLPR
jgi:hypothetical protein